MNKIWSLVYLAGTMIIAAPAQAQNPPIVHINDPITFPDFDAGFCRGSMIPEQDPVFTEIRRSRFQIDKTTDVVSIPSEWIKEAKEVRIPQLKSAVQLRLPKLLQKTTEVVGRPFRQKDFDYFFYLCPYFGGGTASARVYPMFMYLKSAVGPTQQWPDWLFTDQYLFHEILHNYVMEKIDYSKPEKLTPVLQILGAQLWLDTDFEGKAKKYLKYPEPITQEYATKWETQDKVEMIGLVLTHVHVYGIMTAVYKALGEQVRLDTIRQYEMDTPAAHPSYVRAWQYIISIESNPLYMRALLNEVN